MSDIARFNRNKDMFIAAKEGRMSPEQYAVYVGGFHMASGICWDFIERDEALLYADALAEIPEVSVSMIEDLALIDVDPKYIIDLYDRAKAGLEEEDKKYFYQKQSDMKLEFKRFLVDTAVMYGGFIGEIAVHSTKTGLSVHFRHTNRPAFALSFRDAFSILQEYGFYVKLDDIFVNPTIGLSQSEDFYGRLKIVPVKMGVLITIKSMFQPEQYRELQKQLYGKNDFCDKDLWKNINSICYDYPLVGGV